MHRRVHNPQLYVVRFKAKVLSEGSNFRWYLKVLSSGLRAGKIDGTFQLVELEKFEFPR